MLSPKQTTLYWRTWRDVCGFFGWKNSDSTRRYALHEEAGCPASMKDFANRDFDSFLKFSGKMLGEKPSSRDGERERLIFSVKRDASIGDFYEEYLKKVAFDRFGLGCWEEFCIEDLTQFRNIIHNRAQAKTRPATETDPVLAEIAAVGKRDNIPF